MAGAACPTSAAPPVVDERSIITNTQRRSIGCDFPVTIIVLCIQVAGYIDKTVAVCGCDDRIIRRPDRVH